LVGDAGDQVGGDIAEFVLGRLGPHPQQREGLVGAAVLLAHRDADGLVDDGPGGERLVELVEELLVGGPAQGEL
jgi:hypothetical protein